MKPRIRDNQAFLKRNSAMYGMLTVVALALGGSVAWADTDAQKSAAGAGGPRTASVLTVPPANSQETAVIGSGSFALKQISLRKLSQRSPCAAVALMLFRPSEGLWNDWELYMDGVPTSRTANLLADGAAAEEINRSTRDPGISPFGDQLVLAINITTEKLPSDRARSTILCSLARADVLEMKSSPIETPVRFTWLRTSRQLLDIIAE